MVHVINFSNDGKMVKAFKFPTKIIKKMEASGGKVIYGEHYLGRIALNDITRAIGLRTVLSWVIFWGLAWSKDEAMDEDSIDDMIDNYLAMELDNGTRSGKLADELMIPLFAGYGIDSEKLKEMAKESEKKTDSPN
jgi:hypothetical protein